MEFLLDQLVKGKTVTTIILDHNHLIKTLKTLGAQDNALHNGLLPIQPTEIKE